MASNTNRRSLWMVASASAVGGYCLWKRIVHRARQRARKTIENYPPDKGPLVNASEVATVNDLVASARKRAKKWMSLSTKDAKPMVGQVGGLSIHKKPLLTLEPDYVLKPLISDHRGVREVAFYEAITDASHNHNNKHNKSFKKQKQPSLIAAAAVSATRATTTATTTTSTTTVCISSFFSRLGAQLDTWSMVVAIFFHDPIVLTYEQELLRIRNRTKREHDLYRKLTTFTPKYYGLIGCGGNAAQTSCDSDSDNDNDNYQHTLHQTIGDDAHLLLQDITINFDQPCVMDLKMGTVTYEPDAPLEKAQRETAKYAPQSQFGFRIVGMRKCVHLDNTTASPNNSDTATCTTTSNGSNDAATGTPTEQTPSPRPTNYRYYDKQFGRSLVSRPQLVDAFRTFFSGSNGTLRSRCISGLLLELRPLIRFFHDNASLMFVASSLLIVYEGNAQKSNACSVKMIDFGRVRRSPNGDPGYGVGLLTLKNILTELLQEAEQETERVRNPNR